MNNWLISILNKILGVFVHLFDALFCVILILVHFTPFWKKANNVIQDYNRKCLEKIASKL